MSRISAVSVVHNEERYIEACFAHLKAYVDEFVVIDQESTDRTVELARKFTEKVYLFPRVYYPYAYIHEGMLMARNTWIMKVDPDERWDETLLQQLNVLTDADDVDIISVPMEWEGASSGAFHPRVFRRDRVIWTDSLDARPYEQPRPLREQRVTDFGKIYNLKRAAESREYRYEAARRLLVGMGKRSWSPTLPCASIFEE